MQVKPRFV